MIPTVRILSADIHAMTESEVVAHVEAALDSGDKIRLGMVNAAPDFGQHPQVINGFSELMVEVFGESGRAARSAVGMGSLPGNIAVEIEAIVKLKK